MSKFLKILLVTGGVMVVFVIALSRFFSEKTVSEKIIEKKYISIQPYYPNSRRWDFDIDRRYMFSSNIGIVLKYDMIYDGTERINGYKDTKFYNKVKRNLLMYPIIANDMEKQDIHKNKYNVVRKISKQEYKILSRIYRDYKLDELQVRYDKDYLPVELLLMDRRNGKWTIVAKYSYPYSSKKEFDSALEACLNKIKSGDYLHEE